MFWESVGQVLLVLFLLFVVLPTIVFVVARIFFSPNWTISISTTWFDGS